MKTDLALCDTDGDGENPWKNKNTIPTEELISSEYDVSSLCLQVALWNYLNFVEEFLSFHDNLHCSVFLLAVRFT